MERDALISRFREGYAAVERAVDGLTDADLDRPGPEGGWTPRQVVHHLADSEATAYDSPMDFDSSEGVAQAARSPVVARHASQRVDD